MMSWALLLSADPSTCRRVQAALEPAGVAVRVADRGDGAFLGLMRATDQPRAVLIDWQHDDGPCLAAAVRNWATWVPVVAIIDDADTSGVALAHHYAITRVVPLSRVPDALRPARRATAEAERRRARRLAFAEPATLRSPAGSFQGLLHDCSLWGSAIQIDPQTPDLRAGASVECLIPLNANDLVRIPVRVIYRSVVAPTADQVGCEFRSPPPATLSAWLQRLRLQGAGQTDEGR